MLRLGARALPWVMLALRRLMASRWLTPPLSQSQLQSLILKTSWDEKGANFRESLPPKGRFGPREPVGKRGKKKGWNAPSAARKRGGNGPGGGGWALPGHLERAMGIEPTS